MPKRPTREPFAFVYQTGEFRTHFLLKCIGIAIQDQLFQLLVSLHQNGTAGSLIDTTGLHANDTVLYDIYDTDTVLAAQLVQGTDDIGFFHFGYLAKWINVLC